MALIVLAALFYQFVLKFDFEGYTAGDQPLVEHLPEDGYQPISYPPLPYGQGAEPTPEPVPTPRPTAIPIEKYSMLNKRILMPQTRDVVLCGVTECRSSAPDDNRALILRGWGYLEGLDASNSQVYLVVSTKYGDSHRFYLTKRESGSSGLIHSQSTGRNLDQADFSAIVRIEDTYIDGDYRLGVMVVNREGKTQTRGYARLDPEFGFSVTKGQITGFAG